MGKYIFVNLVTLLSVFLGLISIWILFGGNFYLSLGIATLAFCSDSLDGYLARRWNAQTTFGAIFDSISDLVVYVIYPALVFYLFFGLSSLLGLALLALFVVAAIFRLIRFTVSGFTKENANKYYIGIPVVFSHFLIIVALLLSIFFGQQIASILLSILILVISFAMVSKIRVRKPLSVVLYGLLLYLISLSIVMIYLGLRLK